eukprot:gene872-785_t
MGIFFKKYLHTEGRYVCCSNCGTHFALCRDLLSTNFRGRTGAAMLFDKVVNVTTGPPEDSVMTTGLHTIRIIYCLDCHENVGWKYEVAFEDDQKYKEGRYILEEGLLERQGSDDVNPPGGGAAGGGGSAVSAQ